MIRSSALLFLLFLSVSVMNSQTCETGSAITATRTNVLATCTNVTSMVPTFSGSSAGLVPTSLGGTTNFLRSDGTWGVPSSTISYPLISPTFTGTLSGPLVHATGGIEVTGNSSLPAATNSGLWMASGLPNPVLGRIYIGDGTGLSISFAKRTGGVDTEVMHFIDDGSAVFDGGVTTEGSFTGVGFTVTGTSGNAGSLSYIAGSTNVTLTSATGLDFITSGTIRQLNLDASGNFNYGTNLQKLIDANRNLFPTAITASGNVAAPLFTAPVFTVSAATGVWKPISFNSAGLQRWQVGSDNTAESGSNSGSNFELFSYADNGSTLANPISIVRSTGQATFSTRPLFGTATPWDSANFTPSNYLPLTGGTVSGPLTVTGNFNANFAISSTGVITGASLNTTGTHTSSLQGISDAGDLSVLGTATMIGVNVSSLNSTGAITSPTATAGTSTTQVATTAFVQNAVNTGGSNALIFGRITIQAGTFEGNDSSHTNLSQTSDCVASPLLETTVVPSASQFTINMSPSNIAIVLPANISSKQDYMYVCKP